MKYTAIICQPLPVKAVSLSQTMSVWRLVASLSCLAIERGCAKVECATPSSIGQPLLNTWCLQLLVIQQMLKRLMQL